MGGTDQAGKLRLVAVDNDSDSVELIARVATECGYDARSITDPRGLDRVLVDWKPHVVTLELCMPEVDGVQILSLLQHEGFSGDLVIINAQANTLRAAAQSLAHARGLKVAGNLPKPISVKALSRLLTRAGSPRR